MPEYKVTWSGEIVEHVSDQFVDEWEDEAAAEIAGYEAADQEGVENAEVYVELVIDEDA